MVSTPWWILALLVQISLIGIFVAVLYYVRTAKAYSSLAASQQRLQQQLAQATEHKLKIAEMELQLESLETFQELYTELQEQHQTLQKLHDEFADKANAMLSEDDRAALHTTLQQLQDEKARLEQKLKSVGASLQEILVKQHFVPAQLEAAGKAAMAAADEVEKEVSAIGGVIEQQRLLIMQLNQQVSSLQLEVDAKQSMQTTLGQLQAQNRQMSEVQEELKVQNRELREQIQAMEVKERADGRYLTEELARLQQALSEKEQMYRELHKQHVALEAEYQRIYAKSQKIQA
jgi:chromosome segregation ATPase